MAKKVLMKTNILPQSINVNKKCLLFLLVLFLLSIVMATCVLGNKFIEKGEALHVAGHELVFVDVSDDDSCIFRIDGKIKVVDLRDFVNVDGIKIFVKDIKPFHEKTKGGWCDTIINVIEPGDYVKEEIDGKYAEKNEVTTDGIEEANGENGNEKGNVSEKELIGSHEGLGDYDTPIAMEKTIEQDEDREEGGKILKEIKEEGLWGIIKDFFKKLFWFAYR